MTMIMRQGRFALGSIAPAAVGLDPGLGEVLRFEGAPNGSTIQNPAGIMTQGRPLGAWAHHAP